MLQAILRLEMDAHRDDREPAAGEVPNPINPPSGCAFHPRCPHANDRCWSERPSLLIADGTLVACHSVAEGRLPGG